MEEGVEQNITPENAPKAELGDIELPPTPPKTFKNMLQAKKRLQAFSNSRTGSPLPPKKPEKKEEIHKEHEKSRKKSSGHVDVAKTVIKEIEQMKRDEQERWKEMEQVGRPQQMPGPTVQTAENLSESKSRSKSSETFKKVPKKSRNYRSRRSSTPKRPQTPPKPPPQPVKTVKSPESWSEFVKAECVLVENADKRSPKGHTSLFQQMAFQSPSLPIVPYKMRTAERSEQIVPFEFIRYTESTPTVTYGINFTIHKRYFLTKQLIMNSLPKENVEVMEKLYNNSLSFTTNNKNVKGHQSRAWYRSTWHQTPNECKLLDDSSLALTFIQTYSGIDDEDEIEQQDNNDQKLDASPIRDNPKHPEEQEEEQPTKKRKKSKKVKSESDIAKRKKDKKARATVVATKKPKKKKKDSKTSVKDKKSRRSESKSEQEKSKDKSDREKSREKSDREKSREKSDRDKSKDKSDRDPKESSGLGEEQVSKKRERDTSSTKSRKERKRRHSVGVEESIAAKKHKSKSKTPEMKNKSRRSETRDASKSGKTDDTEEYHSHWESEGEANKNANNSSSNDAQSRVLQQKTRSWESDEELFDRTTKKNSIESYSSLEIPLNLPKRFPATNLDSETQLQLRLLEEERRTLSEERRKLEIEKAKILQLQQKNIAAKEPEQTMAELSFESLSSNLFTEEFNESALENEYEEFIKAVSSDSTKKTTAESTSSSEGEQKKKRKKTKRKKKKQRKKNIFDEFDIPVPGDLPELLAHDTPLIIPELLQQDPAKQDKEPPELLGHNKPLEPLLLDKLDKAVLEKQSADVVPQMVPSPVPVPSPILPVTGILLNPLLDKSQEHAELIKPFIPMTLPTKKTLVDNSSLNLDDEDDEELSKDDEVLNKDNADLNKNNAEQVQKSSSFVPKEQKGSSPKSPPVTVSEVPPTPPLPSTPRTPPTVKTASVVVKIKKEETKKRPRSRSRSRDRRRRSSPAQSSRRQRSRSPRRRSSPPTSRHHRRRSPSPRNRRGSPPSRRRRKSSPLGRSSRKRSLSPLPSRYRRSGGGSSPLEGGFRRSAAADSTISDDMLPQPDDYHNGASPSTTSNHHGRYQDSRRNKRSLSPLGGPAGISSPRRISLDDRINQVLGLENRDCVGPPPQTHHVSQQHQHPPLPMTLPPPPQPQSSANQGYYDYGHYERFHGPYACGPASKPMTSKVVQVGNILQVVPADDPMAYDTKDTSQKIVQVGNMLQIVPGVISAAPPPPPPPPPPQTTATVPNHEAMALKQAKLNERRAEKEKRRQERQRRRKEKERKLKEREKKKEQRIKLKTEKMIKKALELETDIPDADEVETDGAAPATPVTAASAESTPSVDVHSNQSVPKSILITGGSKTRKSVQFADGIRPGEGSSPSAGEELSSPPPRPDPPKKLLKVKERRHKSQSAAGKRKKKIKVKVKRISLDETGEEEEEEEDNLPPPSPPPGSPPPHVFPSRVKAHTVNNVHQFVIGTANPQQFYRVPSQLLVNRNVQAAPAGYLPPAYHMGTSEAFSAMPSRH